MIDNNSFCLHTFEFDPYGYSNNLIYIMYLEEEGVWIIPNALWLCDKHSAQYIPFVIDNKEVKLWI